DSLPSVRPKFVVLPPEKTGAGSDDEPKNLFLESAVSEENFEEQRTRTPAVATREEGAAPLPPWMGTHMLAEGLSQTPRQKPRGKMKSERTWETLRGTIKLGDADESPSPGTPEQQEPSVCCDHHMVDTGSLASAEEPARRGCWEDHFQDMST
ncbi:Cholesterol 25-hydroxylase-like protein, partial [Perkinsus olseni]